MKAACDLSDHSRLYTPQSGGTLCRGPGLGEVLGTLGEISNPFIHTNRPRISFAATQDSDRCHATANVGVRRPPDSSGQAPSMALAADRPSIGQSGHFGAVQRLAADTCGSLAGVAHTEQYPLHGERALVPTGYKATLPEGCKVL